MIDIKKIISDPWRLFPYIATCFGGFEYMNDDLYLRLMFRAKMGKRLNLEHPQTFNEKLQWLKLYDRKKIYTKMVDKYEVKHYVKKKIGDKYIVPTYGIWDCFEAVDFDKLPNQFVLKTTHDSGGVIICKDKKNLNLKLVQKKMNRSLRKRYYLQGREWPYKEVKPRILAEKYIEDSITKQIKEYKFFCFDGVPRMLLVCQETAHGKNRTNDFYDLDFNHLDFINGYPNAKISPSKPKKLEEMKELARVLSENIPHLRVDFYEVNEEIYFGELTFSHWSGMMPFSPDCWDAKLGKWIKLPKNI